MPFLQLLSFLLHLPRYFLGHCCGHAALMTKWIAWALEGWSDQLTACGQYLCDLPEGEEMYGGEDDGDDGGLAI